MRKFVISIFALLALTVQLNAQNVRAVVDEVLSAMPAANAAALAPQMSKLAAAAPGSVELLGAMLEPAAKAKNAPVEYAISGIVRYASMQPAVKDAVLKGLKAASSAQNDSDAKAFLEAEIRLLGAAPAAVEVAPTPVLSEKSVLKAIRSNDRSTRVRALNDAPATDSFAAKLVKAGKAKDADADVLYWLAENGIKSQLPYVLKQIDGANFKEAIRTAAILGGDSAAQKLCSLLSTDKTADAVAALKYFKGDISGALAGIANKAEGSALANILDVASSRHITSLLSKAVESRNFAAMKGLVGASDASLIASLLDGCAASDVPALQDAYAKTISYSKDPYKDVMAVITGAKNPSRFFKALSATGSSEALNYLASRYWDGKDALQALSSVNDPSLSGIMLDACKTDEKYLPQYLNLVACGNEALLSKAEAYKNVMAFAKSVSAKKKVLSSMSAVALPEMLSEVDKYLDDASLKRDAALAAKKIIVSASSKIDKSELKRVAARVSSVLSSTGKADDGYAVMEIKKIVDAL